MRKASHLQVIEMIRFLGFLVLVTGMAIAAPSYAVGSNSGSSGSSGSSSSSYGSSSSSSSSSNRSGNADEGPTEDVDELLARARTYLERGWYRRAVGVLREATILEPFNADAWNELGFAYRNVENYNQSARAYDRALAIDPEHLGALNYQGFMFLETDKPDSARDNLARLNALCGDCSEYQGLKEAIDAL